VPGLAAVALLLWRVPDRPPAPSEAGPAEEATREKLPRSFWTAVVIFAVFALANSTDAFLLLRAHDAGVPLWEMPLLWAFFQGVKAAAGVPGGALSDRIGRLPTLAIGWTVYVLSYVGLAFAAAPAAVWPIFAFYGLFFALTEGAERALVADLVGERLRGRAFGAFHAAVGVAALPASLLFGILWKVAGPRVAFLTGAGLALVSTIALVAMRSRIRPEVA
jgi:MFS family permease